MRVNLCCPWYGKFPSYWEPFVERINAVQGDLTVMVPTDQVQRTKWDGNFGYVPMSPQRLSEIIAAQLGIYWPPTTMDARGGYKLCDLRPMIDALFEPVNCDYWGWLDCDIVLGKWSDITERAEGFDLYSTAKGIVNGPLTLIKNTPTMRDLFRRSPVWQEQITNPDYVAFDEIEFSRVVREAASEGLITVRDEYCHTHSGMDSRTIQNPGIALAEDGRLIDTIQGREVAYFHFPHWKTWPVIPKADGRWHPRDALTGAPAKVLPVVFAHWEPMSVVDFGCNVGEWLEYAAALNAEILGVDGPHHRDRLRFPLDRFHVADLTVPLDLGRRFDMAICLEVAEHIPVQFSDVLIDTIARHSDQVLWSAASPGQGGYMHINCQPVKYWQAKFEARGFVEELEPRQVIRRLPIPSYYAENIRLYRKAQPS